MALTGKQRRFIDEYLKHFNATKAAVDAGYSPKTAYNIGWENVRKHEIAEAISKRLSETAMGPDEVLMRLGDQARGNLNDFVCFNDNGDPQFDLQAASIMGKLQLAKKLKTKTRSWSEPTFNVASGEIESRQVTETAIEFELYDAQSALVQIGKHHGLFVDKSDVTVHGNLNFTADEAIKAQTELDEWKQQTSSDVKSSG